MITEQSLTFNRKVRHQSDADMNHNGFGERLALVKAVLRKHDLEVHLKHYLSKTTLSKKPLQN